jgi:hypothetical protein
MFFYGSHVLGRPIAKIRIPAVFGILLGEVSHVPITGHLCKNARRRNGDVLVIAFDDACMWNVLVRQKIISIDQDMFKVYIQGIQRLMHRFHVGL